MPYIKTLKEMNNIEYVEFIGKIKEAMEECSSLKEDNGKFYVDIFPATYDDKISEEHMNDVFRDFLDNDRDDFYAFLENKLLEDYNYGYETANDVFDEMLTHLDEKTKLSLEVAELLGEINSKEELLEVAGYTGISIDVRDFLEDEYHLNLATKYFDTRNLSERLAEGKKPDDLLTHVIGELGKENMQEIIDEYSDRDNFKSTEDRFQICATVDKDNIFETLENIAKAENSIEITGGIVLCEELDKEFEIKGTLNLPANRIGLEDTYVKDEWADEYYGKGTPKSDTDKQREDFREAFVNSVKAVNNGSMEVELYFDYRDKYDEGQIAEMYNDYCHKVANGSLKGVSFTDYYAEQTYEALADMENDTLYDVVKQAENYLKENNPEAYRYMLENEINDTHNLYMYAVENTDIAPKYDVYELVPKCRLDIMIATKSEMNIENSAIDSLANAIEYGEVEKEYANCILDNGLIYLLNQQGRTAEELVNPTDKYMEEAKDLIKSQYFNNQATTILVSAEGKELLDLLNLKTAVQCKEQSDDKKIEIEAGASVYLHNEYSGDTKDFMPTEMPIVIPESMIFEIMVEGGRQRSNDYTVDDVCGLVHSEWDGGAKLTDKEPVPIQNNLEQFLETVKESLEVEKKNEQEGIEAD